MVWSVRPRREIISLKVIKYSSIKEPPKNEIIERNEKIISKGGGGRIKNLDM